MDFNKISEIEKGYLLGLLAGDGYLFYDKKSRHYQVELYLNSKKDKAIVKLIVTILRKIKLIPQFYNDKRFNCIRIRTYSKELYLKIKENQFQETKDFQMGFVSGFIDSDGYYNKKKSTLVIINTDLSKLKKAKEYLENLQVKCSLKEKFKSKNYRKQPYNLIISVKFKSLNHLSQKVHKAS